MSKVTPQMRGAPALKTSPAPTNLRALATKRAKPGDLATCPLGGYEQQPVEHFSSGRHSAERLDKGLNK